KLLATGDDTAARVWDMATGQLRFPPLQHASRVHGVAFSPDGRLLVTVCVDKLARVWDTTTGQPCGMPLPHGNGLYGVAFSPDGRLLATASWGGVASLWRLPAAPARLPEIELRT